MRYFFTVGLVTGLIVACGLSVCFFVRVRQLRREQDAEGSQADQNTTVFSMYASSTDQNINAYENLGVKLPNLPEYSPAITPPAYDQIDGCKPYNDAEKAVPPVYEEIASPVYENLPENREEGNAGEHNEAYVNEENDKNKRNV